MQYDINQRKCSTDNLTKDIFLRYALDEIPRILANFNCNVLSSDFGGFDRMYWGWKFKEMPDSSLQYAIAPLTWAWLIKHPQNPYYSSDLIKYCVMAGITQWLKMQNRNGSFDQCFPFEQSIGATAYTLAAVIQAYQAFESSIAELDRSALLDAMHRAGMFVLKNDESYGIISNHLALYAVVMHRLGIIFNEDRFIQRGKYFIELIKRHMSPEGWMLEYQGADPSYQSQALSYMAEYYLVSRDESVFEMIRKCLSEHFAYFVHPDGSIGGLYGSRNAEIYYPASCEILANRIDTAKMIAAEMRRSIVNGSTLRMNQLDFPNSTRLASNYFLAYQISSLDDERASTESRLPMQSSSVRKYFSDIQTMVFGNDNYYMIVNANKGGTITIFDKMKRECICNDGGYWGETSRGVLLTTQMHQNTDCSVEDGKIVIRSLFHEVPNLKTAVLPYLLFKIFSYLALRPRWLGNFFKNIIANRYVKYKKPCPVEVIRTISYNETYVVVTDEIQNPDKIRFKSLNRGGLFTPVHMASANYLGSSWHKENLMKGTACDIGGTGLSYSQRFAFAKS